MHVKLMEYQLKMIQMSVTPLGDFGLNTKYADEYYPTKQNQAKCENVGTLIHHAPELISLTSAPLMVQHEMTPHS